jgi:hypothetical protein
MTLMTDALFIYSPLNRSGTSVLSRFVQKISQYHKPENIGEDYFLYYFDLIETYFANTRCHWSKDYGNPSSNIQEELILHFGELLLSFSKEKMIDKKKKMLFKSPKPDNIRNFFELFPHSKMIIIWRDGKDTVESFTKSFEYHTFKDACKLWNNGCNTIDSFLASIEGTKYQQSVLEIQYENLISGDELTFSRLSNYLEIDGEMDINKIFQNMPLYGSSTNRGKSKNLTWEPLEKPKNFKPIGRSKNWSYLKKIYFEIICKQQLKKHCYTRSNKW